MPGNTDRLFRLTTEALIQLLSDPAFYTECVAWFWLRSAGLSAAGRYHAAIAQRGTEAYRRSDDSPRTFAPVIGSFLRHTVALYEADPRFIDPLRKYLGTKLGYTPDAVLLTYKEGSETQEIYCS